MSRTNSDSSFSLLQHGRRRLGRGDGVSDSADGSRNRTLSIRSGGKPGGKPGRGAASTMASAKAGLSLSSLRGTVQPELSRKLFRLIKSQSNMVTAHEAAGRERISVATQLSEWGEQTGDDAVNDISDKIGVILSEMGEQEDMYAHALDEVRGRLKSIRNTEKSVQPSRENKAKVVDEIAKTKMKDPDNIKIVVLEQELVRAEAENLVAEAQLTNITRQKLKEAYDAEFAATIERAEKQIILAKHGRRMLSLLDDTPVVPGDAPKPFLHGPQARQVLNDAEDDLRDWQPDTETYAEPIDTSPMARGKSKEVVNGASSAKAERDVTGTDATKLAPDAGA